MLSSELIKQLTMANPMLPTENLIVGGQPSIEDLQFLTAQGLKTVVNLRPVTEANDFDEQAVVQKLGLNYCHIPVSGINCLTKTACETLKTIVERNEPCLIHCATGNRVGALFALKFFWLDKLPAEQCLEYGRQSGLTMLEAGVRRIVAA